jgi:hypothetical protein
MLPCLGNCRRLSRLSQGARDDPSRQIDFLHMLAFHCAGIDYPFAYSYDDLIEFVRFPHLSFVMGCLALGHVFYFFSFSFHLRLRPACFSCMGIVSRLP